MTVNLDAVTGRIDLGTQLENDGAVDAHAVLANHALRRAAGGDAGVGQHLVQALLHAG
jgi:hypothetical protein